VTQICEFILTESRHFPAKLLQTSPPDREETRYRGQYQIIDLDLSKYDRLAMRFQQEISDDISFLKSGIQTRNEPFNALIERIEHVALRTTHPILLTGPTGAGKSRLARQIFELKKSRRRLTGNFIEVNCATLRGDTAMSTLFGHKKGAFTGASEAREGLLRSAHGGMLFLDEIGELGLDEQAMLLRAIEEKKFLPLGSDREQGSDFQLICGSNRDLPAAVAQGRFRDDLLARINLWTFDLPSLKDRPEDIEPNIQYELSRYENTTGNHVSFNKEAKERFLSFASSRQAVWKANFRDLIGSVTRMATLAPGGRITVQIVEDEIKRLTEFWQDRHEDQDTGLLTAVLGREIADSLDEFDKAQLAAVLRICQKSKSLSDAGRQLFAVSRQKRTQANDADRLRKYLVRFGITWNDLHQ